MRCDTMLLSTLTNISWFMNPCSFTVFSTDDVSVQNLNTHVLNFLSCLWSDQSKFMAVLLFLDAFTKLQKATISFAMFARPSA
jgi:hypothetical protein